MGKILVTGASGHLGRKTLQHLLKRRPASDLVGLARDPSKAADLAEQGIEIRKGDYFDYDSLLRAFAGIEKVMLIATHGFTDRNTQHYNAITAARQAGVTHIGYHTIIRREGSNFVLPEGTVTDAFGEQTVIASGLAYTIFRHPPFHEVMQFFFGEKAYEVGVRVPEGQGKAASATRDDLAEAHAVALSEPGHENKIYTLAGSEAYSFAEIAEILSDIKGRDVPFVPISDQQYIDNWVEERLPEPVAGFALGWVHGINSGEYGEMPGDLERLIGHKPLSLKDFLHDNYPTVIPELEAMKIPASA